MRLEEIFSEAGIKMPPIEELCKIKTTMQAGPKIGKLSITLALDCCDELDKALDKVLHETLEYRYYATVRFGYETKVKIVYFSDRGILSEDFGSDDIELSYENQQYVHKIMDNYIQKEYGMTADEMWRKEW